MIDVAVFGIGMAVVATVLWLAYRTMDRPRLPVIREPNRAPRVIWQGVVRYAVMTPVLVTFWMLVLVVLIATVAQQRGPNAVLIAACSVIAGARLLAHVNTEIATELAKTVPIVILSVLIIGGQVVGVERFFETLLDVPVDAADTYFVGLVVWDYLLTGLWFWRQRREWHREGAPGTLARFADRWRRIGYDPVSGTD